MLITGLCFHEWFMFSWINSQIFALLVAKSRVRADIAFFMLDARVTSIGLKELSRVWVTKDFSFFMVVH